ncbi:MAG: leucyl aminopeptidase [Bacteroidota bacterium]|nr:leucyl aminopeptidase [Candidatus Kapabacteria bacterium]MDW8219443.1 leucyl aminopeptidase [Bacteroidota bacterium]
MKLAFSSLPLVNVKADALVVFVPSDEKHFKEAQKRITFMLPETQEVFESGDFTGKRDSVTMLYTNGKAKSVRLCLVGVGEADKVTLEIMRRAAAAVAKAATSKKLKSLAVAVPSGLALDAEGIGEAATEGLCLAAYKLTRYFSDKERTGNTLEAITFCSEAKKTLASVKKGAEYALVVAQGTLLARTLANIPNNDMYPEKLAEAAHKEGKEGGFKVTVLDKKRIEALKMHGLLAVNQGSKRPPVFIIMEYNGGSKGDKPIILVGKGVTFDTGGISIKPATGMAEMKMDMHGAATVIATLRTAAQLGLPLNLIGLIPATENMPSGSALVPGDVIVYSNGVSVEVDNTDAEGRLILADALIYAQQYKPQACIDLATLTGACVIALGSVATGMMGTDATLKSRLKLAGEYTHEYVCELPLHEEYEELIKSDIADVKNSGGRSAGAITGALFLKRFVGDMPWVHLDIAGTAILSSDMPYTPKGASGVGVRLLIDMLRKWKT